MAIAQEATPRITAIAWPDASVIGVSSGLHERLRDVDKTLLPVLVPRPFFDFSTVQFVGQELEYAATVQARGAVLSVVGTRIAVDAAAGDGAASEAIETELGEKSASASVQRYGAAYVVTVECEKAADLRCAKDQYARDLLAAFELVGGGKGA